MTTIGGVVFTALLLVGCTGRTAEPPKPETPSRQQILGSCNTATLTSVADHAKLEGQMKTLIESHERQAEKFGKVADSLERTSDLMERVLSAWLGKGAARQ